MCKNKPKNQSFKKFRSATQTPHENEKLRPNLSPMAKGPMLKLSSCDTVNC